MDMRGFLLALIPLACVVRCTHFGNRLLSSKAFRAYLALKCRRWSALIASIVLGNARELICNSWIRVRHDSRDFYRRVCLKWLRFFDSLFGTRLHDAEIVRLHASGCCRLSDPDAFLERFNDVPVEILDCIFQKLSHDDISRLQLVSRQWRSLVRARRQKYAKKVIESLTIDYDKRIVRVSTPISTIGIFGSAAKRFYPNELAPGHENVHVMALDVNVHAVGDDLDCLYLDVVDACSVKFYLYVDVELERMRVERLLDDVERNPHVAHVGFVSFGNGRSFPTWFRDRVDAFRCPTDLRCY